MLSSCIVDQHGECFSYNLVLGLMALLYIIVLSLRIYLWKFMVDFTLNEQVFILLSYFIGMKPKINILDILKPAEEVEPSVVEQSM